MTKPQHMEMSFESITAMRDFVTMAAIAGVTTAKLEHVAEDGVRTELDIEDLTDRDFGELLLQGRKRAAGTESVQTFMGWLNSFPLNPGASLESLLRAAWLAGVAQGELLGKPPEVNLKNVIRLTKAEVQSGHTRVNWAEGLINQLPLTHEGRNSWLLNYGTRAEAVALRQSRTEAFELRPESGSIGSAAPLFK